MAEVTIQTTFGEIRFSYNTPEELTAALQSIEGQIGIIQAAAKKIAPPSPRVPKPGCEEIYRFLPSGRVELFHIPSDGNKAAALALFAYSPEMVTADEVGIVTGIEGAKRKVLDQTNNRKYFRKLDECYGLLPAGFKLVTDDVVPALLPPAEPSEEDQREGQPKEDQSK